MHKSNVSKIFGEEMRKIRKEVGLSQEALALKANVDRSFMSKMERGIRQPTITIMFKLCDALDIQPEKLIASVRSRL